MSLREEIFECMDNSLENSGLEAAKRDPRLIAAEIVEYGGMPQALADDHDVDDESELDDAITKIELLVVEWQEAYA